MPEHPAFIAIVILDRPTCVECVAVKVGMKISIVADYLERLGGLITVSRSTTERCRQCGNVAQTVSIGRNGHAAPATPAA